MLFTVHLTNFPVSNSSTWEVTFTCKRATFGRCGLQTTWYKPQMMVISYAYHELDSQLNFHPWLCWVLIITTIVTNEPLMNVRSYYHICDQICENPACRELHAIIFTSVLLSPVINSRNLYFCRYQRINLSSTFLYVQTNQNGLTWV